jgi:hypothetical protein
VGVPFILGLVIYLVIIFGMTLWLCKYHSLKCRQTALENNAAKIANNESQTTDPRPGDAKAEIVSPESSRKTFIPNHRDGSKNQESKKR